MESRASLSAGALPIFGADDTLSSMPLQPYSNRHPVVKICSKNVVHLPAGSSSTVADASCSDDPDGRIVSYHWEYSSSSPKGRPLRVESPHSAKTKLSGLENGYRYAVKLTVTDNEGVEGVGWFTIEVGGERRNQSLKSVIDFSDSRYQLSSYYFETGEPWSFNVSKEIGDDPAGRFELRYGDKKEAGKARTEISYNSLTSQEVWIGFSLYLPKTWTPDSKAEILQQINTMDTLTHASLNPPVALSNRNGLATVNIFYSLSNRPNHLNATRITDTLGKTMTGRWVDYVMHTKYSQKGGFVQVWQDGKKLVDYKGPVGYKHCMPPFVKFGIYKWGWTTKGPSDVSKRVAYYDNIKIADERGYYALVAPSSRHPLVSTSPEAKVRRSEVSIQLPHSEVYLEGSPSSEKGGRIVSWRWRQLSGPSQSKIEYPKKADTRVLNLKAGDYVYQVKVTDNGGKSATAKVKVHVSSQSNEAPIARVKRDNVTIQVPHSTVYLESSNSIDKDGKIVSWRWTQLSGPSQSKIEYPKVADTRALNLKAGDYVYQVKVTDNGGKSAKAKVRVHVSSQSNEAPIARVKRDNVTIQVPHSTVYLESSNSIDKDGKIVSWRWTQLSGPSQSKIEYPKVADTRALNLKAGTYVYLVKVTDDGGKTSTAEVKVHAVAPKGKNSNVAALPTQKRNRAPTARVKRDNVTIQLPHSTVYLESSNSSDKDGKIVSRSWTQLSGPSKSKVEYPQQADTRALNLEAGTYLYQVKVTDNGGKTATAKVRVHVKKAKNKVMLGRRKEEVSLSPQDSSYTKTDNDFQYKIYPNPATHIIHVKLQSRETGKLTITIYDMNGVKKIEKHFEKNQKLFKRTIDISHLPDGMYFVFEKMKIFHSSRKLVKF